MIFSKLKIGDIVYYQEYKKLYKHKVTKITKTTIETENENKVKYKFTMNGEVYGNKSYNCFLTRLTNEEYLKRIENQKKNDKHQENINFIKTFMINNKSLSNFDLFEKIVLLLKNKGK